tara:strand:- start:7564 stop:9024 length:1461 start_codon:yes stop_codon:yes gene_type:complete
MTEDIYRHQNGLKHINIINSEDFSALFVVNTPIFDNSGVAHGVEHMVFRRSTAFPHPETLFQLTSLTDAKINASTCTDTTYFHCQSQCSHTFMLAINYLLNGLFNPIFDTEDLHCEIHDGNDKGVIYQELIGSEQEDRKSTKEKDKNYFCYGGISASIGDLSLNDLTAFHQRFYQASNITLVTANADIEQIANLIALLPKQDRQSKQIKIALDKNSKNKQDGDSKRYQQKKYSQEINKLITVYHLWLQDPYHQEIDDYKEIACTNKVLEIHQNTLSVLPQSNLISPLIILLEQRIKEASIVQVNNMDIESKGVKQSVNTIRLPSLFTALYQKAKKQLTYNELSVYLSHAYVCDQSNVLWIAQVSDAEKKLATITSYIISAYPRFLAPRCQGLCYATHALTIENSAYLAIYSAFDVSPETRLKEVLLCLLKLSQDDTFINTSLALAKIKYCLVYQVNNNQVNNNQVMNITSTDISAYLQMLINADIR